MTYSRHYWVPLVLLAGEAVYIAYVIYFFVQSGRFPPPIFYDAADTFGDYFNTNYWAWHEGRFDEWKSIYPMFCFFLGKLVSGAECAIYADSAYELRNCDIRSIGYLVVAYVLGAFFSALVLVRHAAGEGESIVGRWRLIGIWFLVIVLSLPGLFALERGNYIIFSFLFLSVSAYCRSASCSAISLALAISIKQYLAILLIVSFVKRQFGYVGLTIVVMLAVNVISLLFVPEPHSTMLIENVGGFSGGTIISFFEKIWNPTSLSAWLRALENSPHVGRFLSDFEREVLLLVLALIVWAVRLVYLGGVVGLLAQRIRELPEDYLKFFLLIGLIVATDSVGGYAPLLLFPYVGAFLRRPIGMSAIVLVILALVPIELPVGPGRQFDELTSYLSGISYDGMMNVTFGAYLRPFALIGVFGLIVVDLLRHTCWISSGKVRNIHEE